VTEVIDRGGKRLEEVAVRLAMATRRPALAIGMGIALGLAATGGGIAAFLLVLVVLIEVFA
jgi:hypothetical protein